MVTAARSRAKAAGVPVTIVFTDVVIPSHCPVLGIPLFRRLGRKGGCDNSPSLDRIVPETGYIPGNIIVVSRRANRIKNDATLEELERVSDFYRIGLKAHVRSGRQSRIPANP